MPRKLSTITEDDIAAEVETLAREHDLTEQEAVRQLLQAGLEALD